MLSKLNLKQHSSPWVWGSASLISLVLLGLVLMQVDFSLVQRMAQNITVPAFIAAFAFLTLEGIFTSLRIWVFAARKPCLSQALRSNAWYVLLLVMLPARLGEVAAIVVFERYMGQKHGAAAMSIVAQRLYDVIVLGTFFLIALIGLSDLFDNKALLYGIGAALIIFCMAVLYRMELFLTIAAALLRTRRTGLLGKVLRLILQARIWTRHIFQRKDIGIVLFLTTMKWVCNLGALVFLFRSIRLGLPFFESVTTAAAYNFLAIIPLQTIGGIGVGEAGLALLLGAMGLSASMAASASIMVRLVIIVFPFIFWVMVMGGLRLKEGKQ